MLRLPSALCQFYNLRSTVNALESQYSTVIKAWGLSPWLYGQLLLMLDEALTESVGTFRLTYDAETGSHDESMNETPFNLLYEPRLRVLDMENARHELDRTKEEAI